MILEYFFHLLYLIQVFCFLFIYYSSTDGGTDALPSFINTNAAQPSTKIFAHVGDPEGNLEDRLHALICCQVRGRVLWVWGARTREEQKGKGMGKQMLVSRLIYPL